MLTQTFGRTIVDQPKYVYSKAVYLISLASRVETIPYSIFRGAARGFQDAHHLV